MTAFLKFDRDGRCIGREARTDDQLSASVLDGAEIIGVEKWNDYRELHKWWRDGSEIKPRVKVLPPVLPRQRMHSQMAIRWLLTTETPTVVSLWTPETIFRVGDHILVNGRIYACTQTGITGSTEPRFNSIVVAEPMPWVVWNRAAGPADPWQPSTLYRRGERVRAGGATWVCITPGVTRSLTEPDWEGDEVDDRDYILVPLVDLGGEAVILNVAGEHVEQTGPLKLVQKTSGRFLLRIDSPGFYSDDVLVSVEEP